MIVHALLKVYLCSVTVLKMVHLIYSVHCITMLIVMLNHLILHKKSWS